MREGAPAGESRKTCEARRAQAPAKTGFCPSEVFNPGWIDPAVPISGKLPSPPAPLPKRARGARSQVQPKILADLGGRLQRDTTLTAKKTVEDRLGNARFLGNAVFSLAAVENGLAQFLNEVQAARRKMYATV